MLREIVAWRRTLYHKANNRQGIFSELFSDSQDLFQHAEISEKSHASDNGEFVEGLWATLAGEFLGVDEIDFFESSQVGDEIAIRHIELGLEILEWPRFHARGEQRHDGESPFLVNGFIELGEIDHAVVSSRFPVVTISPP